MAPRNPSRRVHLFRNGRNQAVRIPREFELPGDEAILRRDAATGRLILEPAPRKDLVDLVSSWGTLGPEDDMPEIEDLRVDPVDF
jgi:antitoxin VapB